MNITKYCEHKKGDRMKYNHPLGTIYFTIEEIWLYEGWGTPSLNYIDSNGIKFTAELCEKYIPTPLEELL